MNGVLTSESETKMETQSRNDGHVGERVRKERWKRNVGMLVMSASGSGNKDGNAESE